VNGFGPAHIEKSHFKGIFGCIFRQSLMKYGGNKSINENSLRPLVLIHEDSRHSMVTRKIPLFSVEPVTISYAHYWVHWCLPVKYFTCKKYSTSILKGILSTTCVIFSYPKLLSISVLTFIKWRLTPSYVAKNTKKTQNYRYQNYCPDDNIQICSYGLLCEHVLSMRTV
jgi:hypothetical protein